MPRTVTKPMPEIRCRISDNHRVLVAGNHLILARFQATPLTHYQCVICYLAPIRRPVPFCGKSLHIIHWKLPSARPSASAELTRCGTCVPCLFPAVPPTDKPGCPRGNNADKVVLVGWPDL
jgi:hypothetical protein